MTERIPRRSPYLSTREILLPLHASRHLCRNQELIEPALPDAGGAHKNQEPPSQMVRHLLSGVQRRLQESEGGKRQDGVKGGATARGHLKARSGKSGLALEKCKAERCRDEEGKDLGISLSGALEGLSQVYLLTI